MAGVPFHSVSAECQNPLTFPRQQFIRTRSSCRTIKLQTGRTAKTTLHWMTANSFECHPTTVGWQSDQQKEWQTAAGVKYNERTVQNRLLGQSFNNQLRFAKDPKDWPLTDVWNVQLRPGEAYKLPTVKLIGGLVIICFSKAGIRHIRLCEGTWIKPCTRLSWKKTCSQPLTAQRIGVSSSTMLRATRPGQKSCGWRTTRSRPCHGQPNLQTWTPFSQPTAMSKTGREHAKMHESCDWKSGSFHKILISEHFQVKTLTLCCLKINVNLLYWTLYEVWKHCFLLNSCHFLQVKLQCLGEMLSVVYRRKLNNFTETHTYK